MMKRLAVIMSIYNGDKLLYLSKAIESILNQSFNNFDFYLYIDGQISIDKRKYLENLGDDRIRIYSSKENKGLANALNELLKVVLLFEYDYIARMDADDISVSQRFLEQIKFLDNNKDIDCVGTWCVEIDENDHHFFEKKMPITHDECFEMFKKRDFLVHPTVMFRRTYFNKVSMYPINTYFAEDTMMWALGLKNGCKFSNLPEYLFYFRINREFFKRRRGFLHFYSILKLRIKITNILNFGIVGYFYAILYSVSKLLPSSLLKFVYKNFR